MDYSLAYLGTDTLEFVLHLFWVFQVYDVKVNLVTDTFFDNMLGYTYCY